MVDLAAVGRRPYGLALLLGALSACGGAPPARPPASRAGSTLSLELAEARKAPAPARPEACERALDALAERLGRGHAAPDEEVRAVGAVCPPADADAIGAVLDARERRFLGAEESPDDLENVRQAMAA